MFRLFIALLVISSSHVAFADDWSHTAELTRASSASIRVVEPEGYQVTVNGRTDTIPAVFAVPDADNYLMLAARAPSGATWEQKIEVKAYHQSVIHIRHVASPTTKAEPARRASYVGVLANTTHLCKAPDRRDIRVELILGADLIKAVEVNVRTRVDVELPAGEYQVRRFQRGTNGWEYAATQKVSVDKDGWIYHWGC